jgi:hypothetical protein
MSTICDWQAIGVRRYDPDGPVRVLGLHYYHTHGGLSTLATSTEAWRPSTIPWATLTARGALAGDAVILI